MTPEYVPAELVEIGVMAMYSDDPKEWHAAPPAIHRRAMDRHGDDVRAVIAAVMSKVQALPDATGGCVCSYTTEDRGAGHSELVGEYEPACPVHSEHVYDPIQGMWVFRGEVPTNPTKPVDPWAERLDCPKCCPGPCCDHRNTEYGNCTDCHNTGHNHAPCPDHKSNRATNLDGAA